MLELIACSPKAAPLSEIGEGVRRYNAISLLVSSKVLITINNYLGVVS